MRAATAALPADPSTPLEASMLALLRTMQRASPVEQAELDGYLSRDWRRFIHTLRLCEGVSGRCLELGAGPYFTTVLLREYTALDLTLTNYFGEGDAQGSESVRYASPKYPGEDVHHFAFDHFNVEGDRFPYPDHSFDLVLFCEILEHLTHDPLLALREIKRVLKPGGRLVLTTPNAVGSGKLWRMIRGASVQDRYSGYGPYGRHNREYTLDEVKRLLEHCGFAVVRGFTADAKRGHWSRRLADRVTGALIGLFVPGRARTMGQYLFVAATNEGPAQPGRPSWLFRSFAPTD